MTWQKDGQKVELSDRVTIEMEEDESACQTSLIIAGVIPTDKGKYQIEGKNEFGEANMVVSLIVKG